MLALGPRAGVTSDVTLGPRGEQVLVLDGSTITAFDLATGAVGWTLPAPPEAFTVAGSPGAAHTIALTLSGGRVMLLAPSTGQVLAEGLTGQLDRPTDLEWDRAGRRSAEAAASSSTEPRWPLARTPAATARPLLTATTWRCATRPARASVLAAMAGIEHAAITSSGADHRLGLVPTMPPDVRHPRWPARVVEPRWVDATGPCPQGPRQRVVDLSPARRPPRHARSTPRASSASGAGPDVLLFERRGAVGSRRSCSGPSRPAVGLVLRTLSLGHR